jgi:hypothetical protein
MTRRSLFAAVGAAVAGWLTAGLRWPNLGLQVDDAGGCVTPEPYSGATLSNCYVVRGCTEEGYLHFQLATEEQINEYLNSAQSRLADVAMYRVPV